MFKNFQLKNKHYLYLALFMAFILRVFNLNYDGFWNDEIYTAITANPNLSIKEVVAMLQRDIHPPLHNILANIWNKIFVYNDTSMRIMTALTGVWGVKSVYDLGKLLFNKRVAWFALGLAIVNYFLIYYSQEFRSYSLLFVLTNYSYYYYIKLVRDDFSPKASIGYALVTAAMLYTHYFSLLVLIGQFSVFFLVMDWKKFKSDTIKYIITFAAPVLLYIFWIPTLIDHLSKPKIATWRDPAELGTILKYFHGFFNEHIISSIAIVLLLITLLYLIVRIIHKSPFLERFFKGSQFSLIIIVSWIIIIFMIPYFRTILSESLMVNRYFIHVLGPILLLLAFYLNKFINVNTGNKVFLLTIAYSVLILFLHVRPYFGFPCTYREIALEAKELNRDAPILCISRAPNYLNYYLRQNNMKARYSNLNIKRFRTMIVQEEPDSYLMLLDLNLLPNKYKDTLPSIDGYQIKSTSVQRNKPGKPGTKLIEYVRETSSGKQ